MAKAVYLGERPASWGPIGTMIVIGNLQTMFEHEAEEATDEQPKVTQPETTTSTPLGPTSVKPNEAKGTTDSTTK